MNGLPFGLIIESVVAVLLALTIGYCFVLNQRLKLLHSDRETLREMISDLVQATNMANGAIKQLREVASEADMTLNVRLEEAERFGIELANHVSAGQSVLERITKITSAARASETIAPAPANKPDAKKSPLPANRAQMAIRQLKLRNKQKGEAA